VHEAFSCLVVHEWVVDSQADAVGVVDETGALKSWLSASDMRGMSAQSMKVWCYTTRRIPPYAQEMYGRIHVLDKVPQLFGYAGR
jgi:hypothetical protein